MTQANPTTPEPPELEPFAVIYLALLAAAVTLVLLIPVAP